MNFRVIPYNTTVEELEVRVERLEEDMFQAEVAINKAEVAINEAEIEISNLEIFVDEIQYTLQETIETVSSIYLPNFGSKAHRTRILLTFVHNYRMNISWFNSHKTSYRSGTVNSKSFVGKVFLRIKWKFELN